MSQNRYDITVPGRYEQALSLVKEYLGHGTSFDVVIREVEVGGRRAFFAAIDGFVKDDVLLRITNFLQRVPSQTSIQLDLEQYIQRQIGYIEVNTEENLKKALDMVLGGPIALFIEGAKKAVLIDARTFPARSPSEPDMEKVLRGPKDGLTETIVFNTALIRRRIRDPQLRVELHTVGARSKTDVVMMYIADIANPQLVETIRQKIQSIVVDGMPMAEKTLEEFLIPRKSWWNPFPVTRFTERPDTAAVHLLEGHIVLLVDTSPIALILPTTFFHHLEHAQEFHEDTIVGILLRFARYAGLFLAWVAVPLWVAFALQPEHMPSWLRFSLPEKNVLIPLFVQFIMAELGIELIRMALIHTPTALATSLGIIGAVLLGQLAVEVGLFTNEAILYATLAALGLFTIPSMELSQAIRVSRVILLLLAGVAQLPGVIIGFALNVFLLAITRSYGVPYLWPLIPFDYEGITHVLIRRPVPTMVHRPKLVDPQDPERR